MVKQGNLPSRSSGNEDSKILIVDKFDRQEVAKGRIGRTGSGRRRSSMAG